MKHFALLCGLLSLSLSLFGCQQTPEFPEQYEPEPAFADDQFPDLTDKANNLSSSVSKTANNFQSRLKESADKFRTAATDSADNISDSIDDIGQQFEPVD
jgi:tryptophanyl-tRNA synthetase